MKNNGGPAFPIQKEMLSTKIEQGHLSEITTIPGMTLCDYFAAQAMQGILSCFREYQEVADVTGDKTKARAKLAYKIANAMIEEKQKLEEQK